MTDGTPPPGPPARPSDPDPPTSSRPHRAARLEDRFNRTIARWLWSRGWRTRVEPYVGYGGPGWVRVLARTVLSPARALDGVPSGEAPQDEPTRTVRGWRSLATAQVPGAVVEVRAGSHVHRVTSDRGGYVDTIVDADLEPGWHTIELVVPSGSVSARVLIVSPDVRTGLVSDIDDTVMVTTMPRPLIAAWNTFVLDETARRPVTGMADLYRDVLADHPDAPVLYLSTGAWNVAPTLGRFLTRHGYPAGPLLLTDWGPTNTGWFRSGRQHKLGSLERLMRELPHVRWLLVGDDGQHDPEIYDRVARHHPDRVRAVAIRELTPTEHTLAAGVPQPLPDAREAQRRTEQTGVPVVRGGDGATLGARLTPVLADR
ncbi:App1 family protein [uncultured Cellulomonas sp.]|uniref:App1 family protein n=1 Tax=uncultured Cellulomonas sp. TaxID=189682 RepID=UPI002627999E|nr:phosphatase domain-containing protein [uncultured Cellulomonas sp.]